MVWEQLDIHKLKTNKNNLDLSLTLHMKNYFKIGYKFKSKIENYKTFREKTENFQDLRLGKESVNRTPKAKSIRNN